MRGLNIANLPKKRHYCRQANKEFWLDWSKNKLESKYLQKYGNDFCLIFYQTEPPYDYYAIPYFEIEKRNPESHLRKKGNGNAYIWGGSINKDHQLIIRKEGLESIKIDISNYYNTIHSAKKQSQTHLPDLFEASSIIRRLPLGLEAFGETFYRRSDSPEGWLYILNNPSWPGWVKIGITRDLSARLGTYNTGSPYEGVKYQYCYHLFHENARQIEKIIHDKLSESRNNEQSKEWYRFSVEKAIKIIQNECRT